MENYFKGQSTDFNQRSFLYFIGNAKRMSIYIK